MITITYDLLFKILYIALALIHFIVYAIIFIKLRGIKNGKTTTLSNLIKTVKTGINKGLEYLAPTFPNIIGLIKAVTGGEKKDNEEGGENG